VPHGIVHLLEPVEIEQKDRTSPALDARGIEDLFQPFRHLEAVGELGERIETRELRHVLLRLARLGQVGARTAKTHEVVELVHDRSARNGPPAFILLARCRPNGQFLER